MFLRYSRLSVEPATMTAESQSERCPPTPTFFVSADSKGLNCSVSPLEATLTRCHASVDFKRLRGLHNHEHRLRLCADSRGPSWVIEIMGLKTKKAAAGLPHPKWKYT